MAGVANAVSALAAKQHGIVTRRQLLVARISKDGIDGLVRRGSLQPLHAGVYQVGPISGTRARELAAALACRGVVSHRSAAVLREVAQTSPGQPVEISVAGNRRIARPGIRVYRCILGRGDVEKLDGIPVTSLARTVFDFAAVATARELEQALAAAERTDRRLTTKLRRLLERYPSRRGTRALRQLLGQGALTFTRSEAEERLLALIRSAGLAQPQFNVMLHGFEVDCFWAASRLVVEVDGYAWHGSRHAFLRDRRRDSALAAAGIRVLRLSWQQLTRERDRTLVQLALAIARGY